MASLNYKNKKTIMPNITYEELTKLLEAKAFDTAIYKLTACIQKLQERHDKRAKKGFNSELYLLRCNLGHTYCEKNKAYPHLGLWSLALECYLQAFELITQSSLVEEDADYYFQEKIKIERVIVWLAQEVIKEVDSQMEAIEQAWEQLGEGAYDFELEKKLSCIIGKLGYLSDQAPFTAELGALRRHLANSFYYVGILLFNHKDIQEARVNLLDARKIYVEHALFEDVFEVDEYLLQPEFLVAASVGHPGASTGQILQGLSDVAAAASAADDYYEGSPNQSEFEGPDVDDRSFNTISFPVEPETQASARAKRLYGSR